MPTTAPTPNPDQPSWLPGWRPAVVVVVTLIAYANSFGGTFVFDDVRNIYIPTVLDPFPLTWVFDDTRPFVTLSFALNYGLRQLESSWGYHAFNVAVHTAAALLLYGLVRRTLELPRCRERYGDTAGNLALAAALIWAVHPLTTQAVTYIVQRAESMMGMFYLLSLYALNRGATSAGRPGAFGWYAASVAAAALSMGSKQIGVTIPAVALLYDRCFLAGTFRGAVVRRWALYPLLACGLVFILPTLRSFNTAGGTNLPAAPAAHAPGPTGQVVIDPTMGEYARTQPEVILYYLRLAAVPHPLCIDHAWEVANGPDRVVLPALFLGVLVVASLWALWRRPGVGFLVVSFFLILSPSSSFLPITDLMFEHRMYLPLASVVVLAVILGDSVLRWARAKWGVPDLAGPVLVAVVVAGLAVLTVSRNEVYRTDTGVWRDVVAKRPDNPRGHYNLGTLLFKDMLWDEAIPELEAADRIGRRRPMTGVDLVAVNNNLGSMYVRRNQYEAALERYREALKYSPENADVKCNLANALIEVGKPDEAAAIYKDVLAARPGFPSALRGTGKLLGRRGDFAGAARLYEQAVAVEPNDRVSNTGLAIALRRLGRYDDALPYHRKANAFSNDPSDRNNLGLTLLLAGRPNEVAAAVDAFRQAVQLAPQDPRYRGNLALALDLSGQPLAAEQEYRTAVGLAKDWPLKAFRAAWDMATSPDPGVRAGPEAVILARQVIKVVGPTDVPAGLDLLAAALATAGKYPEAATIAKQAVTAAEQAGQKDFAEKARQRLKLYELGKPFIRS